MLVFCNWLYHSFRQESRITLSCYSMKDNIIRLENSKLCIFCPLTFLQLKKCVIYLNCETHLDSLGDFFTKWLPMYSNLARLRTLDHALTTATTPKQHRPSKSKTEVNLQSPKSRKWHFFCMGIEITFF